MSTFSVSVATKDMQDAMKAFTDMVAAGELSEADGKVMKAEIVTNFREAVAANTRHAQISGTNKEVKRSRAMTGPDSGEMTAPKMVKTEPLSWGDFTGAVPVQTYKDMDTARAAVAGAEEGIFGADFKLAGRSKGHPRGSGTAARGYCNWEFMNDEELMAFVEVRLIKDGPNESYGIYQVSRMHHHLYRL